MTDYALIKAQAEAIIETEPHYVAALSNISALIYESLDRLNWAGFYLMDRGSLLVGPFQGKTACIRIEIGKGVCGTAVKESGEGREDPAGGRRACFPRSHRL